MIGCRTHRWLCWLGLALGCQQTPDRTGPVTEQRRTWTVPAADPTSDCADLSNIRVCWGKTSRSEPGCDEKACVVERTVPELPSSSGWRCTGTGPDRICRPRSVWASPFVRQGDLYVQVHPRFPDDGQWECIDTAGVTVCAGGTPPAGAAPSAPTPGYRCGERPGKTRQRRVCVDLSPDFPTPGDNWTCRFVGDGSERRECKREDDAHQLGDSCSAEQPCVDGARCLAGRCIPARPEPSCVFDQDCASGVCRFGSCMERLP